MTRMREYTKPTLLLSFFIASADMRYNEVAERRVYLYHVSEVGWVIRGEIPGCGSGCYVDLGQIFLEYALSCEGCRDQDVAEGSIDKFGTHLGVLLAAKLDQEFSGLAEVERLSGAFTCVLNSSTVPFTAEQAPDQLSYSLAYCPICEAGKISGLNREAILAHRGFILLCESIIRSLAPDWKLQAPAITRADQPLLEIKATKS